ncbi:MAG: NAD(P)-dependent oxidoreductase [Rhodospirillales bacterium]|nr:NAD(P)-dependent oxidoreductase [Alphaproteobacteria bacterium]MBL6948614.1 NAD(P)-dependent oxidoreductase [Rhodospirillales bacterium]
MSEGKKILITGGAGYLGSVMTPMFLHAGHSVTVLDNFMFRQAGLAAVCHHPRFDVVNADARNKDIVKGLVKDADIVIPLAALVGAPLCDKDPLAATSTNLDAVLMLLDLLSPDQWVLLPNTNSGYGIGEGDAMCTEESPLNPVSLYGRDKVAAEAAAMERENSVSFRLATVFGMSPRPRIDLLVNDFVHRAVTDRTVVLFESHFKRNYIHIRDVARAFLHAFKNFDAMKGQSYNVGLSDANLSKKELCETIQKHIPNFIFLEAPIGEDPDKRDYIVSNEKIEATGYAPKYSLDDGIQELMKGYRMIRNSVYANI